MSILRDIIFNGITYLYEHLLHVSTVLSSGSSSMLRSSGSPSTREGKALPSGSYNFLLLSLIINTLVPNCKYKLSFSIIKSYILKQAYGPIATLFDIFMRPKNLIYHMQFTLEVAPP